MSFKNEYDWYKKSYSLKGHYKACCFPLLLNYGGVKFRHQDKEWLMKKGGHSPTFLPSKLTGIKSALLIIFLQNHGDSFKMKKNIIPKIWGFKLHLLESKFNVSQGYGNFHESKLRYVSCAKKQSKWPRAAFCPLFFFIEALCKGRKLKI